MVADVNVVLSCLYNAVNLTLVREQRIIGIIYYYYYHYIRYNVIVFCPFTLIDELSLSMSVFCPFILIDELSLTMSVFCPFTLIDELSLTTSVFCPCQ